MEWLPFLGVVDQVQASIMGPCRAGGTSYQREMNGTDAFELRPMKSQVATKTCRILKPAANPVTKGWEETSGEKSQGGHGPYQEH